MDPPPPSPLRRALVALALLVPLVVDPHEADTLVFKQLALAAAGLLVFGFDALGTLLAGRPWLRASGFERLLVLLATWGAISLTWADNPLIGLPWLAALLGMAGVSRGLRSVVRGAGDLRRWTSALVVVGVIVFAVDGTPVVHGFTELSESNRKYASWLFRHNNMAANYAAILVPLGAALVLAAEQLRKRLLWTLAVVALLVYLVLLGSRAGLAAAALGGAVFGLLVALRRTTGGLPAPGRRAAVVLGAFVAAGAVVPLSETVRGFLKARFYDGVHVLEGLGLGDFHDAVFRSTLFRKAVEMASEQPLRGVGAGNFPVVYPRYEPLLTVKPHAHNDLLQAFAELGLPGVLVLLSLFALLVIVLLRAASRAPDERRFVLAGGMLGSLATFVVCGFFEVPFTVASTASVLALVAGLAARLERPGDAPETVVADGRGRVLAAATLAVSLAGLVLVAWRAPASMLLADAQEHLARSAALGAAADGVGASTERQAAVDDLRRLAALPTGNPLPWTTLGRMSLEQGDAESALPCFQRALQLWPYSVELIQDEGEALLDLGRHDEALERFHRAVATSPARKDPLFRLVFALSEAGRRRDAIDLLEHQVQSRPADVAVDLIMMLANQWREEAEGLPEGPERVRAFVAARHFYAVVLEDGDPQLVALAEPHFQHCTHVLQSLPGSPDSWWKAVYEPWLDENGWTMPQTALWTAMDATGRKIYPGWEESAGPPLPRAMR
ncbi:MAG: O-antigen ligase family protein [Planctomycetes bacterium]|nr:O-antigen ligase family protein [Planctomycetota bacterium]